MKYLKLYEAYNETYISREEAEKIFTPLINWNIIEDAKDMSLEYLDEGMILQTRIGITDNKKRSNRATVTYAFNFSHEKFTDHWFGVEDDNNGWFKNYTINKESIKYYFKLSYFKNIFDKFDVDNEETIELVNRLKMTYPEYNINSVKLGFNL